MPIFPLKLKITDLDSDSDEDINETAKFGQISPRIKSEAQLLREKNIRERNAFFMNDPDYAEAWQAVNSYKPENTSKPNKPKPKVRRSNGDANFRFFGNIPTEKRKSARLENKPPIFTKDDLIDESSFNKRKRSYDDDDDLHDLENIIFKPKRARTSYKRSDRVPIITVEEVTDDMIANISRKVSNKVYSDTGSSCHQCRQKTKDQKTCCRNSNCVGVRGQFCGVCLQNRYGEDAAVALRDPEWNCPVCRGICNCSFCRARAGKRPTGILAPLAQQAGHRSVMDLLNSLKGEGDYVHQDDLWKMFKDPENLLGFSKDLKTAHMGGNTQITLKDSCILENLNMAIQKEETHLEKLIRDYEDPSDLLGFGNGLAYMSSGELVNSS